MTRQRPQFPLRKFTPLILILAAAVLFGCSLIDSMAGMLPSSDESPMSIEEALAVEPDDARPKVMEEMGPPDAFSITFDEIEGQIVRWETWFYFDFNTQFDFIDGELLWTIELEPTEDGSIFAHWYDPQDFQAGMSRSEVESLLSDQELFEIDTDALDLEGGLILAGDQILLGLQDDRLVYVETMILSPDPEGQPLADLPASDFGEEPEAQPTQEPTLEPTAEPTAEPTPEPTLEPTQEPTQSGPYTFEDDFDGADALAVPIFNEDFMEYGVIDGEGILTSHFPAGILVAYYQEPVLADFTLELDLRPLGFAAGSKAGAFFRSEQPDAGADYYNMVSILPVEGRIIFQVWYGGEWAQYETRDIPPELVPLNGIYRLKIDCQGKQIKVYLEDQLATEFTSDLILDPGYFGLAILSTRDPESAAFDNLVISEIP